MLTYDTQPLYYIHRVCIPSTIRYLTWARGDKFYVGFTPYAYGVRISHLDSRFFLIWRFLGYEGRPGYGAYKTGRVSVIERLEVTHYMLTFGAESSLPTIACVSMRQTRQHSAAYLSISQHTPAYIWIWRIKCVDAEIVIYRLANRVRRTGNI